MGRWDGDAAKFFGWDEATINRVEARKRAKAPATGKKSVPVIHEVDWRRTDWRSTPWRYEGNEDLLTERNGGTPVEGAEK